MSKLFLTLALIVLTASCVDMSKAPAGRIADEEPDNADDGSYPDDEAYSVWAGPGWYWGIYIGNEDDYWNHYNRHYNQGHGNRNYRNRGGGHGHGHGGGGGHH